VIVSPEVAEPFAGGVTDAGIKVQLTPAGQFVTVSATALLYPEVDVTVIVEFTELP